MGDSAISAKAASCTCKIVLMNLKYFFFHCIQLYILQRLRDVVPYFLFNTEETEQMHAVSDFIKV